MPQNPRYEDMAHLLNDEAFSSEMRWQEKDGTLNKIRCILRSAEGLYPVGASDMHDAKQYALVNPCDVKDRLCQKQLVEVEGTEYRVVLVLPNPHGMSRVVLGLPQENVDGDYFGWE